MAIDHGGTLTAEGGSPVLPDAAATVRTLHHRGWRLVLATNTTPEEAPTRYRDLYKAGIIDCFAAILVSTEIGCSKPEPDFYRHVQAEARCGADRIVFVGDNLYCDVLVPLATGMRAVYVAGGSSPLDLPVSVPHVRAITDLPDTIAAG